jgi:tetratricopeptide (TPR) repeat protein
LATILSASRDYNKAENYFRHTLSIQPEFFSAQHALALMYEEMNDIHRSDSLFLHMIQENKNDAVWQNDYAYILSDREEISVKDLNYALELSKYAIAIEPDNTAFLDTVGWIYYKLGTYQKAEEYIQKSLNINDDNPVILEHMGDIYVKLHRLIEALAIYQKVISIDPNNQMVKDKINKINE